MADFGRTWRLRCTFPAWSDRFGSSTTSWVGDKRNQVVHDVDACTDESIIDELMAAETYICFGPDTLPEARNRGYRRCSCCVEAVAAKA